MIKKLATAVFASAAALFCFSEAEACVGCSRLDLLEANIAAGATTYIQNRNTLQNNTSAYVGMGNGVRVFGSTVITDIVKTSTITGLSPLFIRDVQTIRWWDGTLLTSTGAATFTGADFLENDPGVLVASHTKAGALYGLVQNAPGVIISSMLANSGATAASYTNANITINAQGIVTTASNGSAGAGGSKNFDGVVVGPSGASSIDSVVTTNQQWDLVLATSGMIGLTQSTTAQGKIFLRDGSYVNAITTIPAGATVLCQSSAVLVLSHTSKLVTVYGQLGTPEWPCSIDGGGFAFTAPVVTLTTGSRAYLNLYGMQNMANDANAQIVRVFDSTGVVGDLNFKQFQVLDSVTTLGDRAGFAVRNATACKFNVKTASSVQAAGQPNFMDFRNMWNSRVNLSGFLMDGAVLIEGSFYNYFSADAVIPLGASGGSDAANSGVILLSDQIMVSTGSTLNATLHSYDTGDLSYINLHGDNNIGLATWHVSGKLTAQVANSHTGVYIREWARGNFVDQMYMWRVNTSITDSGSFATTLNYWRNGVHVANN